MAIDTSSPRSRRAILLGALGGAVAASAAAVGRASPVSAADGDVVHVGRTYAAANTTEIDAAGDVDAIWGISVGGSGVYGQSWTGTGVFGQSVKGRQGVAGFGDAGAADGVYGLSAGGYAVRGDSDGPAAIYGRSTADATGILGYSGAGLLPLTPPAKTGVFGYANQTAASVGVKGEAPKGRGVVAVGGAAQLRLVPSAAASHPGRGAQGDLFVDSSGRLWFCKGGAAWVKLA